MKRKKRYSVQSVDRMLEDAAKRIEKAKLFAEVDPEIMDGNGCEIWDYVDVENIDEAARQIHNAIDILNAAHYRITRKIVERCAENENQVIA